MVNFSMWPKLNNRLKSRIPLSNRMHSLAVESIDASSPKIWAVDVWRRRWQSFNYSLKQFIPISSNKPFGHDLNRKKWVKLNRIRSGYGRYATFMHRIGLKDNSNCICGETQTPQHILICQTIGIRGDFRTFDEDFCMWLDDNSLDI